MKIIILSLIILSFCSCCIKQDIMIGPANYGLNKLKIGDSIGVSSFTNSNNTIKLLTIGEGNISVFGFNECELSKSLHYTKDKKIYLSLKDMFGVSGCIYNVVEKPDGFDAPIIGKILVKSFTNQNIKPLRTKIKKEKFGTNEVQVKQGSTFSLKIYPTGSSGFINISGCDIEDVEVIPFENEKEIHVDTIDMFSGTCLLEILVNNDDYLKEESLVYISVYNQSQESINAPRITTSKEGYCFKFKDQYVVGIIVNDEQKIFDSSLKSKKVCTKTLPASVIGFTSTLRMFYGVYDGKSWSIF